MTTGAEWAAVAFIVGLLAGALLGAWLVLRVGHPPPVPAAPQIGACGFPEAPQPPPTPTEGNRAMTTGPKCALRRPLGARRATKRPPGYQGPPPTLPGP